MDATPPNDDPAARFRKPADQAPPPAAAAEAPPAPAGLVQTLEDSFMVPLTLGGVFARRAPAPAPGYGVLCGNVAVFAAASLALNLLRARLTFPEAAAHFPALQVGIGAVAIFCMMVLASFPAAGLLHAIAKAAGGHGGYQRSYQALSLLSAFWPAVAVAHAFAHAWIAVSLVWAFLTAAAIERLHAAPPGATRAVVWTLALASIAAAFYVAVQAQRAIDLYIAPLKQLAQLQRQQADSLAAQALPAGAIGVPSTDPAAQMQQFMLQAQKMLNQSGLSSGTASGAPASGLDMIALPSSAAPADGTPGSALPAQQQLQQQSAALQQSAAGVLGSLAPMLGNPALTKGMPPEQAKQLQQMMGLINSMQDSMKSGKPPTPEQMAQIQKLQQDQMRTMTQMMNKLPKNQPGLQQLQQQQAAQPAPGGGQ